MNKILVAAIFVALALVFFGCTGNGNGAAAPASPGQVTGGAPPTDNGNSGGQGAAPSPNNGGQVAAPPNGGQAGNQNGSFGMMGNNSLYGGVDLTNVSQADSDPTAGLISNEDVPAAPN